MQCHAIIGVVIGVRVMQCHQAINNSGFLISTQLIGGAWACENERVTEKYSQTWFWETGQLSQERFIALKYLEMYRDTQQDHLGTAFSIIWKTSTTTRIDISNHLPSVRTHLRTQLTPQPSVTDATHGHGSYTIQIDKLQLQRGRILKIPEEERLVQSPKEPVVLQLIFTLDGTEHRTRVPDSKSTHNTN